MAAGVQDGIELPGTPDRQQARTLVALGAAACVFALTAFAPPVLNDGDTFLHIAAGARMLADRAILFRDPFSYTLAGAPWNAFEWLAELAMATAFQAGGWSGLLLLFAVSTAAAAGLLAYHLGKWFDWPVQAIVVWLALCCMTASLLARPHLLALPLLEIWTAELVLARSEKRAPSLALLPMMTLWVNIHGGFLVGLALTAALATEVFLMEKDSAATLRNWAVFLGGAVAAALVNPHFIRGLLFPITFMGTASLGNIGEWRPIDFSRLQPLELVALGTIYYIVTHGVKIPPLRALMVLALLHLSFQHQRHQMVFGILAPLLLAEPLSSGLTTASVLRARRSQLPGRLAAATIALIAGLAVTRVLTPVRRSDSPVAPITALDRVPPALRAAHVLNDYSFGGYLIFSGVNTFVDSRAELFGDVWLRQYAQIILPDPEAVKRTIHVNDIRWSIFSPRTPTVTVMDSMPGWHRLYADAVAVVHVRDE